MPENKTQSQAAPSCGVTLKQLTQNYRNARRFLGECNSVAILNQYKGAALKSCSETRRSLIDEVFKMEMGL